MEMILLKEIDKNSKSFEDIKHIDENGVEFWYARELMKILEYNKWENFEKVINKAKDACKNSGISVFEHFPDVRKLSKRANNAEIEIKDYKLTRYACYLIAQNGDSRKKVIALAQTYFAVQTRKQEITEKEYSMLTEDEKRFYQRNLTRKGNYSLNQTAKKAGVKNFDKFHNAGYKGLYNGETADDIAKRKGLRYREDILDNMGSEELADNIFRIAQTDAKLKRDNVDTEKKACDTHNKIGKIVRKAIKEAGDFLADIGIGNVMMAEAATAEWLCRDLALGQNEESVIYDGYYITFTDAVESNPAYLGFCDETNILSPIEGDQRSMTSQIYEVNINDNGIVGIVCRQKYQRSDSKQDQQVLMDWDKLLETVSLEFDNYSNDNISGDIIFNYARLTYCMTLQDNGEFVLSPVWVFLSLDEISLEYQIDAYPNEMLIIDACTGKFITICTF